MGGKKPEGILHKTVFRNKVNSKINNFDIEKKCRTT